MLCYMFFCLCRPLFRWRRIHQQVGDGVAKFFYAACLNKAPVFAAVEDFRWTGTTVCSNHRSSTGHRFQQYIWHPFNQRRQHKHICGLVPCNRMILKSDKLYGFIKVQRGDLLLQMAAVWTVTKNC